jgi:hypothetical protein
MENFYKKNLPTRFCPNERLKVIHLLSKNDIDPQITYQTIALLPFKTGLKFYPISYDRIAKLTLKSIYNSNSTSVRIMYFTPL